MHISSVVHIWSNTNVSFFSTKNYSQIGMTSNNLTIFITLKITIVRQNKTKIVKREIMWADSTPGIYVCM
jgi:hypothetical protein